MTGPGDTRTVSYTVTITDPNDLPVNFTCLYEGATTGRYSPRVLVPTAPSGTATVTVSGAVFNAGLTQVRLLRFLFVLFSQ